MTDRTPPRILRVSPRTMAAWGRVHARILQDMKAADAGRLYDGKVPEAAVFHELIGLAEAALGTGGPPLPADAPIYEAPPAMRPSTPRERADRMLTVADQAMETARLALERAREIDPTLADEADDDS